eukprot:scaffold1635_cov203-Isochrysis_galbana.AAC.3
MGIGSDAGSRGPAASGSFADRGWASSGVHTHHTTYACAPSGLIFYVVLVVGGLIPRWSNVEFGYVAVVSARFEGGEEFFSQ